jgi:hypothetical protein
MLSGNYVVINEIIKLKSTRAQEGEKIKSQILHTKVKFILV